MLEVLLSKEYNLEDRKQILQEEFGIAMTRKMEGEVKEMCNLSMNIYEDGKKEGIYSTVIRMLEENLSQELIIRITGLSKEEIEGIKQSSKHEAACRNTAR